MRQTFCIELKCKLQSVVLPYWFVPSVCFVSENGITYRNGSKPNQMWTNRKTRWKICLKCIFIQLNCRNILSKIEHQLAHQSFLSLCHSFVSPLKRMNSLSKLWLSFANFVVFTFRYICNLVGGSFVVIYNGSQCIRQKSFVGVVLRLTCPMASTWAGFSNYFWCLFRILDNFTYSLPGVVWQWRKWRIKKNFSAIEFQSLPGQCVLRWTNSVTIRWNDGWIRSFRNTFHIFMFRFQFFI